MLAAARLAAWAVQAHRERTWAERTALVAQKNQGEQLAPDWGRMRLLTAVAPKAAVLLVLAASPENLEE